MAGVVCRAELIRLRTTNSTSTSSEVQCKLLLKKPRGKKSEVVITSGHEGGLLLNLKFYTSWTSQLETIVTEQSTAFHSIWYLWSNGSQILWKSDCAMYVYCDIHSLLQEVQRQQ
jgi:hypothetical protein